MALKQQYEAEFQPFICPFPLRNLISIPSNLHSLQPTAPPPFLSLLFQNESGDPFQPDRRRRHLRHVEERRQRQDGRTRISAQQTQVQEGPRRREQGMLENL